MLIKATLLGIFVATTPLYIAATQGPGRDQDPPQDAETPPVRIEAPQVRAPLAAALEREANRHAAALEEREAALREAEKRAEIAEARVRKLEADLGECMDFLLAPQTQHHGCRPSRSLLVHYQWMQRAGYPQHADKALARIVEQYGDDNGRLNQLSWSLMTDEETSGKFDELALALARKMLERERHLDHRQLDTSALAEFLNGHVDEAIRLQRAAIERGGHSDDYRRRLRTYEAAKAAASPSPEADDAAAPAEDEAPAAAPEKKITDE